LEKNAGKKQVINRAEVLCYNLCYGNKKELIKQFNEVRNLNPKLGKPVIHITLSFAPGEQPAKDALQSMVEDCAKELGFAGNQYLAIRHSDTTHQHIHIVANRVGFNGKTVKDNNNYRQIAAYCREMEQKHGLQQVLSPKRFLQKELQNITRLDLRKERLKNDIIESIKSAKDYQQFEMLMKEKKYAIVKARGIAFIDQEKVRTKGSEVGYSLSRIEKLVALPIKEKKAMIERPAFRQKQSYAPKHRCEESYLQVEALNLLLKPEIIYENTPKELLQKKKKKNRGLHL
jgi:hypothetical protein